MQQPSRQVVSDAEALEFGLSELPSDQQESIRRNAQQLVEEMTLRGSKHRGGFGTIMALELLQKLGRFMNEGT